MPTAWVDGGRIHLNPVHYDHPYPSMDEFAKLLALRYDGNRTPHSHYRDMRLLHQYFECDPASLVEHQVRDYFLHVKIEKSSLTSDCSGLCERKTRVAVPGHRRDGEIKAA